jgi:hypothetical protein
MICAGHSWYMQEMSTKIHIPAGCSITIEQFSGNVSEITDKLDTALGISKPTYADLQRQIEELKSTIVELRYDLEASEMARTNMRHENMVYKRMLRKNGVKNTDEID